MGGEGLEPPEALGRLIYSQLLLPLSDPPMTTVIIRRAWTRHNQVNDTSRKSDSGTLSINTGPEHLDYPFLDDDNGGPA